MLITSIIHFKNISLIPIFHRTQVLPTAQENFLDFWTKIFLLQNMFYTFVLIPQNIPKNFQNFSFALFKNTTSRFPMFET